MRGFFILFAVLFVVAIGWSLHVNFNTVDYVNVTVWEKDRECTTSTNSEGHTTMSCRYVVHTDSETFENTDSLMLLKFNSSDVQRNLRTEESFCLKVVGYRITLFSAYRNIVGVVEPSLCSGTNL
jgi:hypothetical protein